MVKGYTMAQYTIWNIDPVEGIRRVVTPTDPDNEYKTYAEAKEDMKFIAGITKTYLFMHRRSNSDAFTIIGDDPIAVLRNGKAARIYWIDVNP